MKKLFKFIANNGFILALIAVIAISDRYFLYNDPFIKSDIFPRDDFDITKLDHPEKEWEKVFFGNSDVIAAYREDLSVTGYVNLGLDCGVVTDLEKMLDKKLITVTDELVIGLDYLALYDDFDTNPSYAWHKKWYEPYLYFERDKLFGAVENAIKRVSYSKDIRAAKNYYHYPQMKNVYVGNLSQEVIEGKIEKYKEMFFNLPDECFDKNIKALKNVEQFCKENDIVMKVVWMPWNINFEQPELFDKLKMRVEEALEDTGVQIYDLTYLMEPEYFHDTSHVEYDVGSAIFTQRFDKIITSEENVSEDN